MRRAVGIALIIIGGLLLIWAWQAPSSNQEPEQDLLLYAITGVVSLVVGTFSIWQTYKKK